MTMTMEGAVLGGTEVDEDVFGTPMIAKSASLVFNLTATNDTEINCDQGMPDVFSGGGRVSSSDLHFVII